MKISKGDRLFDSLNIMFAIVVMIVVLYPLLFVISASFSSPAAINSGKVYLFPVGFTWDGYKAVFENSQVWVGFRNSFLYAGVAVVFNLFMTTVAAYPLSRKDFRYRNAVMYAFAFTMYFGGGLIPTYLVIKQLGLIDTFWVMVIPGAMSVFNVILMRTYIQTSIPELLQEAARMDGCSDFRYLTSILVPLCRPILAVIALYVAVGSWNSYFNALIYLSSDELYPIQIFLRNILAMNQFDPQMMTKIQDPSIIESKLGMQALLKYTLIVVSILPVLMIYPFVQKHFIKGIQLGAIKG
ncbi:ABC-type glycerol-3-phosphate transport system permease component [Paenibacillus eucommiae]|uniref:ABC-type glycerol-3-phosphate transport system permease component n=2 Tax=Paenibacillus eucommiae TaxID=1355755 RepID=A0ABS4IVW2_9BACL|nr:carbohydrate ABC transporter permease [Paenibacillus eucommiae]MBP1991728.1 ABC-type glycerol-3-phosphate transport system permease component [Paenibacillus eucommiae]